MDLGLAQKVVAIITVSLTTQATTLDTKSMKKQSNKHSTRAGIMQLIIEDHVRVMEGKLPENYQAIMDEFTEYTSCGGNKYIDGKVEEYKVWYKNLTKKEEG